MKRIIPLYGKKKNYTLYMNSMGKSTVFELPDSFNARHAVLYVVGDSLFRLPLWDKNRVTVSGEIRLDSVFLVIDGAIAAESGLKGDKRTRERIKSMILNRESEEKLKECAEQKEAESEAETDNKTESETENETETEPESETETENQAEAEYQSQAIQEIINRARELFSFLEQANFGADSNKEETKQATEEAAEESFNPFPEEFPNASFQRRICPRTGKAFLEGKYETDNGQFAIWAVRGGYRSLTPRMRKNGYQRFIRASDGSTYWLKIMQKNG